MRQAIRGMALASVLAIGGLVAGTSPAKAQDFGYGGHHGGGYYGGPAYSYYGNGGHDYQPHWHTRQTPFGGYSYYGMGRHDFRPHGHVQTPYGITSYSRGWYGRTQSYSPPAPYVYMPW